LRVANGTRLTQIRACGYNPGMDYQVELENFRGPMDLLLYLVKHDEMDIFDIPIARITEQFLHYLELLKAIDMDRAGEFLVMASTLMEIKSRMLLPRSETQPEEEDPRLELVRQLIEYKKFKDAAALLEERAEKQATRLPRLWPEEQETHVDPSQQPIRQVELWDLVSAFGRLMRETLATQPKQIILDETPMQVFTDRILARLREQPRLAFAELFEPPHSRGRLIGLFMALLELMKANRIAAEQETPFGEITVALLRPATNGQE
jgi:segregation and condensation protein A